MGTSWPWFGWGLPAACLPPWIASTQPTAAHSLRVALACSHWALALQLDEEEISQIEVAALLHDVGKVAFPDAILLNPGHLAPAEVSLMDGYRRAGLRILGTCCASPGILDIVRNLPAWYDGSRPNYPMSGREIPFGADAGDCRRVRLDDDRTGLSPGDVARYRQGRTVCLCRESIRSGPRRIVR